MFWTPLVILTTVLGGMLAVAGVILAGFYPLCRYFDEEPVSGCLILWGVIALCLAGALAVATYTEYLLRFGIVG